MPEIAPAADELGIVSWVDGRLVHPGSTAIRPEDRGLVGDGVFEAIKVVQGVPFALGRHLDRLRASAEPLSIEVDLDQVERGVQAVLSREEDLGSPCWLRITVTAGPARMAGGLHPAAPTVIVAAAPMLPWGDVAHVVVVPWCRNERGALAGLKTLSYLENGLGLRYARRRGADEGIFTNTVGDLCEGSGSNVFVVHSGQIVTPPLASGCLAGITRALLLESLPEIVEADVAVTHLAQADEAFLTSTSRGIHPIATVDGRHLPQAPGRLTRRAIEAFARAASDHLDRASSREEGAT